MKKIVALLLTVVLTATVAIGGTMAFLSATAEDDNTMTLGNVKIEQHEYEREVDADGEYVIEEIDGVDSYVLKEFTQDKPILPVVSNPGISGWDATQIQLSQIGASGSQKTFATANAVDKLVVVENTGNTAAYVRTIIAIEVGTTVEDPIGISFNNSWVENHLGKAQIDGKTFYLIEMTYSDIVPANGITPNSLSQIYLMSEATNEDMIALDGNGNGKLDVLVFSQAAQAAGFTSAEEALDAAFGDITTTNHPWAS